MANTIIMSKYQGLGNDYLILDPKKNQVQLQGKKIALLCQRGFGLGADGVLYGPVEIDGKLGVRIFNADGSESAISVVFPHPDLPLIQVVFPSGKTQHKSLSICCSPYALLT